MKKTFGYRALCACCALALLMSFPVQALALSRLPAPTGLVWDGTVARWNPVAQAAGYAVRVKLVYEGGYVEATENAAVNSLDLNATIQSLASMPGLTPGNASVSFLVTALSGDPDTYLDSAESASSAAMTYLIAGRPTLDTPQGLFWDGTTARWSPVANATRYMVSIRLSWGGRTADLQKYSAVNELDCAEALRQLVSDQGLTEGTVQFRFSVTALATYQGKLVIGDASAYSEVLDYRIAGKTKLAAPETLSWDGMTARWSHAEHASSYLVRMTIEYDEGLYDVEETTAEPSLDCAEVIEDLSGLYGFAPGAAFVTFTVTSQPEDPELYALSDQSAVSAPLKCIVGLGDSGAVPVSDILSDLPEDLVTIDSEAFANTDLVAVRIPEGCTAIGERAFAGCADLLYVWIPQSVLTVAETAFEGCDSVFLDYER